MKTLSYEALQWFIAVKDWSAELCRQVEGWEWICKTFMEGLCARKRKNKWVDLKKIISNESVYKLN